MPTFEPHLGGPRARRTLTLAPGASDDKTNPRPAHPATARGVRGGGAAVPDTATEAPAATEPRPVQIPPNLRLPLGAVREVAGKPGASPATPKSVSSPAPTGTAKPGTASAPQGTTAAAPARRPHRPLPPPARAAPPTSA